MINKWFVHYWLKSRPNRLPKTELVFVEAENISDAIYIAQVSQKIELERIVSARQLVV